jgi:pyruvate formate lyase activating enzyme
MILGFADRLGTTSSCPDGLFFIPPGGKEDAVTGYMHALESMGLVDGPGVRAVVFLQGCPLRCRYCHNPDTQCAAGGREISEDELLRRLVRLRPYFARGGGVTFSGGEPLGQPEFLLRMLRRLKREGIHTCLDTAGAGLGDYDEILANTDLVLFDVKHEDPAAYRSLTGGDIARPRAFVEAVRRAGVPMWVRHVVVPGLTDGAEHLAALRDYIATLPRVERVELLPYHSMGAEKYAALGRPYSLAGVPDMDKAYCAALERRWFTTWNQTGGDSDEHDGVSPVGRFSRRRVAADGGRAIFYPKELHAL